MSGVACGYFAATVTFTCVQMLGLDAQRTVMPASPAATPVAVDGGYVGVARCEEALGVRLGGRDGRRELHGLAHGRAGRRGAGDARGLLELVGGDVAHSASARDCAGERAGVGRRALLRADGQTQVGAVALHHVAVGVGVAEVARAALAGLKRQAGNEVLRGVAVAAVACDLVLRLHALHLVGGSAVAVVVVLGLGGLVGGRLHLGDAAREDGPRGAGRVWRSVDLQRAHVVGREAQVLVLCHRYPFSMVMVALIRNSHRYGPPSGGVISCGSVYSAALVKP